MRIIIEGEWHPNWTEVRVDKIVIEEPSCPGDPASPNQALPKRIFYMKGMEVKRWIKKKKRR